MEGRRGDGHSLFGVCRCERTRVHLTVGGGGWRRRGRGHSRGGDIVRPDFDIHLEVRGGSRRHPSPRFRGDLRGSVGREGDLPRRGPSDLGTKSESGGSPTRPHPPRGTVVEALHPGSKSEWGSGL